MGKEDRTKNHRRERRLQPRRRDVWLLRSMLTPIIFSRGTLFKDQIVKNVMLNRVHLPHSHFSSVARLDDASLALSLYFLRIATKFWDIKEPPMKRSNRLRRSNASLLSIIYITTLRECYVISLPFKNDRPYLGDSYTIAPKIFHVLERAFVRNPALKEQYLGFTNKYRDLWHMSLTTKMQSVPKPQTLLNAIITTTI
ncbi:hypothetical protein V1477_008068 [Vespula maculifrons]|uniref:Uncharacterized protein n=1 Tax=Vespula maculifrons TaxID=7453 RepID=A0ABD2CFF9_VESMC